MGMRAATTKIAQEVIAASRVVQPAGCLGEVTYWGPVVRDHTAFVVLHSPGRRLSRI